MNSSLPQNDCTSHSERRETFPVPQAHVCHGGPETFQLCNYRFKVSHQVGVDGFVLCLAGNNSYFSKVPHFKHRTPTTTTTTRLDQDAHRNNQSRKQSRIMNSPVFGFVVTNLLNISKEVDNKSQTQPAALLSELLFQPGLV